MAATTLLLPTGRLVQGDIYEPQTKDNAGNLLTHKRGPQAGQPRQQWFFGVAIPKAGEQHWSQTAWGQVIWGVGHQFKPNAGNMRDFAWKITNGDDPQMHVDREGKPRERANFRGHWIVRMTSGFAPQVASLIGRSAPEYDSTPGLVYPGCYIQVQVAVDANEDHQKPGVYLNHRVVCLIGFGERIASAQQDVAAIGFGGPAPAGAMQAPPGVAAMPVAPAVQVQPPAPAAQVPAPNPAFLQPPAAAVAPPAAPARVMTAKAGGASYEQFIAQGWNDDQLRAHGYMA